MNKLDAYFVDKWDALLGKLLERGMSLPALLRELATGRLIAFVAVIGLSISRPDLHWFLLSTYILIAILLTPVYFYVYRQYAKDAQRDWTASLAKVYLDKAFQNREQNSSTRMFDWFFLILIVSMDVSDWFLLNKAPLLVDYCFYFWWIFILLISYTRCVFPRDPTLCQRSPKLALNPT